ncbi:MAG: daunorubicin/doxorubicin resistance ABC transporter ATP-binding protein DrrA, partial [Mesorhizobium sp.]
MNDTSPKGVPSMGLAQSAISSRGLVKTFGKLRAVDGINLDVPRGMIFAILGPN